MQAPFVILQKLRIKLNNLATVASQNMSYHRNLISKMLSH
jgi:hypothetical protein